MWGMWKARHRLIPAAGVGIVMMCVVVVSGACSTAKLARRAHRARVDLQGLSRADLEACAGQPVRTQRSGGWEYATYVGPRSANGTDGGQCVATFMMRNGFVEGLDYENTHGGLIGKSISGCLAIVDPCIKKRGFDQG